MKKSINIKPTQAELEILGVLWKRGPSLVREVQKELGRTRTTVLKFLQIMTEKGLVVRDESSYAHVYKARYSEQQTQKHLVSDLMSRAFGGSAHQLIMQALSVKKVSKDELDEIENLLENLKE